MSALRKTSIVCTVVSIVCCVLAILMVLDVMNIRDQILKWRGPGNLRSLMLSLKKSSDGSLLRPLFLFTGSEDNPSFRKYTLDNGSLLILWNPQQIPKEATVFAEGYCARKILVGQAEQESISLLMDECPGATCTNTVCREVHDLLSEAGHDTLLEIHE